MGKMYGVCPFCNNMREIIETRQVDDLHVIIYYGCGDEQFRHYEIQHDPVDSVVKG